MTASSDPDLLYGVPAIAASLGVSARQVRHLVATGTIPTFKVLKLVCARRSTLITWLAEQEAKARRAAA